MKNIIILLSFFLSILYAEQNTKTVNALLGYDKPPFIFTQTSLTGIEADLLREAFEIVGYKVNVFQGTRAEQDTILDTQNNIDAVATISKKNPNLFYSDTFTTYENYVVTRKIDNIKIDSLEDLKKLKFVTWKNAFNDLGDEFYKLYNPKDGKFKESYHDTLTQIDDAKMFFSNEVDAIIVDKTIFKWHKLYFKNTQKYTFHKIFKTHKKYPVTFRDKKVRDDFNIGLNTLKQNGRYDEIIRFYETQDINELIILTKLLSSVSGKYIFEKNKKTLVEMLKALVTHPDIQAISIKNKEENYIDLNLVDEKNLPNYKDLQKITNEIYYKTGFDLLHLGELSLYFKKDYQTKNGNALASLDSLKNLNIKDYEYLKEIYKELDLENDVTLSLTKKEKDYLSKHQTITVQNEDAWSPHNYIKNTTPQGFSIDYMNLLAKKLNIKIEYVQGYNWSEFLNMIKDEKIDVLVNVVKNKNREKYINFTTPYIKSKKAIFSNVANIKSIADLEGKVIALPRQFNIQSYLRENYPNIKLKTYKSTKDCLYALINKEVDAIIENYAVVNSLMKKDGLNIPYVTISDDTELSSDLRIGVRKSQTILRDILEKAKKAISEEEFIELEHKWFGLKDANTNIFTQQELTYIQNKKSVKVCAYIKSFPYVIFNQKGVAGTSVEFLKHITKKSNLEFEILPIQTVKEYLQNIKDGMCDVAPIVVTKPNVHEFLVPTKPILSDNIVLVTRINEPYVNDLHDLKDEKIGILKGAKSLKKYVKHLYPNMNLIEVQDNRLKKVVDKEFYGYIDASYHVSYKIATEYFNELKIMSKIGDKKIDGSFGITVREPILLSIFNKSIENVSKLEKQNIENAWMSVKVDKQFDYTRFIQLMSVAIVVILILVFSYFKQKKLHKEIKILNGTLEKRVLEEVEKNKLQQLLMLQQNRLAQMGEMISMIAHQWRQPLNNLAILNQTIALKYKKGKLDDALISSFKENSKKQIDQMSNTIEDFKNFFKPEKEKVEFEINNVVHHVLDILNPIFEKNAIKITFTQEDNFKIVGYPNELGQAILNIIVNARDALVENNIENKKITLSLKKSDEKILLSISDNGGGIADDIIYKIFDPYFSTKESKNGTGLGLYMTKMIIDEHMGAKLIAQNIDDGAEFKILF